uniref:Receptor ligand binding region domain-containing protein n=1 Tax=Ditylenchus dipsaci TaxID=166011 RepID=A0A915D808_9BILA
MTNGTSVAFETLALLRQPKQLVVCVFLCVWLRDTTIVHGSALMPTPSAPGKQTVNIGLVYQNYAQSKVYQKAFKEAIRNINTGQSITSLRRISSKYNIIP